MFLKFFFIAFFISSVSAQDSSSSLNSKCKKDGFNCGECETDLQNDFNKLLEEFSGQKISTDSHWSDFKVKDESFINWKPPSVEESLEKIITLFKKHNPGGNGKLNFVVIGESESLHETTIRDGKMYPRIMIKSPNSELMVTFNTDPKAKGYNAIEVMRWNGKKGKYEFQELNYGDKKTRPHLDLSGQKCMECHKSPSARPNWDTYRAWSGVVPSRDDMLELKPNQNGELDKKEGLQPDAKAYLGFLDQIAEHKDQKIKSRISLLDIPIDEKHQFKDSGLKFSEMTEKEKVEAIRRQVEEKGFYRIKHFPDLEESQENSSLSFNFDSKTAFYAGPSQFAFDQMLAQNMCRVATDLRDHPYFKDFKYSLALLYRCVSPGQFVEKIPEKFKDHIFNFYLKSDFSSLKEVDPINRDSKKISSFDVLHQTILEDTKKSHERADSYKFSRHEKFLSKYFSQIEKMSPEDSQREAEFFSEKVVTPIQFKYHAIGDEGGVKGVPEGNTDDIAISRLLLEPFGVHVDHWSLVHGKDNAYNSYSFSDQFELLKSEPIFDELLKEAGSCAELERKAISSMNAIDNQGDIKLSNQGELDKEIQDICSQVFLNESTSSVSPKLYNYLLAPIVKSLEPQMKKNLEKCLTCHGDGGGMTFPGLSEYVMTVPSTTQSHQRFLDFLTSKSHDYKMSYIELIQYKLGLHGNHAYGSNMPPTPWSDNEKYANVYGVDHLNVQNIRRKDLGIYLTMFVSVNRDDEKLKQLCHQISQTNEEKIDPSIHSSERRGVKKE